MNATPAPASPAWRDAAIARLPAVPLEDGRSLRELAEALRDVARQPDTPRADDRAFADGDGYRRFLLARLPHAEALLIWWPPGYGTPVHDHDRLWGIELVLDGMLVVDEYAVQAGATGAEGLHLERRPSVRLPRGAARLFDDPGYAHACHNAFFDRPALSLHVYGGPLERYRRFERDGAGWRVSEVRPALVRDADGTA
ncbi:cysteine dioxygenase [Coralloluteibacterium thermophilus]|uniref:Cysteine dioxygenase n=1 Tax=Coralloluteibacterium thermophilum TaxID=2707049 RepID=A0ABV9NNK3_9GAMM